MTAKKLTMNLKTGKMAVRSAGTAKKVAAKKPTQKAVPKKSAPVSTKTVIRMGDKKGDLNTRELDAILAAALPIINEAPAKSAPAPAKKNDKPAGESKMGKATAVFIKLTKDGKTRKDIISSFQTDCGLTKAGSNTYYALIKAKQAK